MGRRKIAIQAISDSKIRHNTFNKRKNGLIKKAAELSMLCNVKMLVAFEDLHGNLVQYSTHGKFDPKEYFVGTKMYKSYDFTAKHYPNFFKSANPDKKLATDNTEDSKLSDLLCHDTVNQNCTAESLDSNISTSTKMVERINASLDRIKSTHHINKYQIKELNDNIPYTESIDKVRKIQKKSECLPKLEYQSDNEEFGGSQNLTPKIEFMQEEVNDIRSSIHEESSARFHTTNSDSEDVQSRGKVRPDAMISNPFQNYGFNYSLNSIQSPLTSLLLQNTTKDLMALSKSLLLFSSLTNTTENIHNLTSLLMENNQKSHH